MDAKRNSPLTCEQVSELISEYIDRELDDVTAAAVASHIDNCDACPLTAVMISDIYDV